MTLGDSDLGSDPKFDTKNDIDNMVKKKLKDAFGVDHMALARHTIYCLPQNFNLASTGWDGFISMNYGR